MRGNETLKGVSYLLDSVGPCLECLLGLYVYAAPWSPAGITYSIQTLDCGRVYTSSAHRHQKGDCDGMRAPTQPNM